MKNNILIYGSYGFSGNLIVDLACKQGLKPILAGRNKEKLAAQAEPYGLEYRAFDTQDKLAITKALDDVAILVHCAGPFIHTFANMVEACLETNTHYIDITGEVEVIDRISTYDEKAKQSHILLLPGAGFDVVPSDCLAQYLKSQLPDATKLTIAIRMLDNTKSSTISRGTAKSMLNGMHTDTLRRKNGVLESFPSKERVRTFHFGNTTTPCLALSWGDLASAWWSTHIPNIETFMAVSKKQLFWLQCMQRINFILRLSPIQKLIENYINKMPEGPGEFERLHSSTEISGEVKNKEGKTCKAIVSTSNAYTFTSESVVAILKKLISADNRIIGFHTPSTAFGKDFILEIPGGKRVDLTDQ